MTDNNANTAWTSRAANDGSADPSWMAALACHWKGALVAATVAGLAAAMADNPMQRSTQVQFLASAATVSTAAAVTPADLARALTSSGISDKGRDVAVIAKTERDSELVSVSFTIAREVDEADATLLAEDLVKRVTAALGPQLDQASQSIRARKAALEEVSRLIDERTPGPSGTTEAIASLVAQRNELRQRIADATGPVGEIRGPELVGSVRTVPGRSVARAWAAPAAAFAVAFAAAPLFLRSLAGLRRSSRFAAQG